MTFERAFEMITNCDYLKRIDNGPNIASVPMGTYLVKKFKEESIDKICPTSLIESVGVIMVDKARKVAAFGHFHPINCLSPKLTEKSLLKIKKDFAKAGGIVANAQLRVIGGLDDRIRNTVNDGCKKIFANCEVKIDEGFYSKAGSNHFVHAIITAEKVHIAKLERKENVEIQGGSDITSYSHNVVKIFPENEEDEFFSQCQYIKSSSEQTRLSAKASLMIRKTIADLLKIDVASNGSNIFYDLNAQTYEGLIKKDASNKLALRYYYRGCSLVPVQNMMKFDKDRKIVPVANGQRRGAPCARKNFPPTANRKFNKNFNSRPNSNSRPNPNSNYNSNSRPNNPRPNNPRPNLNS